MAFKSDNKALRTFDPETGWELKVEGGGYGIKHYKLVHPNLPSIPFEAEDVYLERTPMADVPGQPPAHHKIMLLTRVDWDQPDKASPEKISLIAEALKAYRYAHSGPDPGLFELKVDTASI
jgi:hypothetical protein